MGYDVDRGFGFVPVMTIEGELIGVIQCLRYADSNWRNDDGSFIVSDSPSKIMNPSMVMTLGLNLTQSYASGMLKSTSGDESAAYGLKRFSKSLNRLHKSIDSTSRGKPDEIALIIEDGDSLRDVRDRLRLCFKKACCLRTDVSLSSTCIDSMVSDKDDNIDLDYKIDLEYLRHSLENVAVSVRYPSSNKIMMDALALLVKNNGKPNIYKLNDNDALWAALNDDDSFEEFSALISPLDTYFFSFEVKLSDEHVNKIQENPDMYIDTYIDIIEGSMPHNRIDFIKAISIMVNSGIPLEKVLDSENFWLSMRDHVNKDDLPLFNDLSNKKVSFFDPEIKIPYSSEKIHKELIKNTLNTISPEEEEVSIHLDY